MHFCICVTRPSFCHVNNSRHSCKMPMHIPRSTCTHVPCFMWIGLHVLWCGCPDLRCLPCLTSPRLDGWVQMCPGLQALSASNRQSTPEQHFQHALLAFLTTNNPGAKHTHFVFPTAVSPASPGPPITAVFLIRLRTGIFQLECAPTHWPAPQAVCPQT